jgi:two-component system chemotaxis response regulator CheB
MLKCEIVVVGSTAADLGALEVLFWGLPGTFPLPIVLVSNDSDSHVPAALRALCPLPVEKAEDKQSVLPGRVYVSPPDYHLLIDGQTLSLSTDVPEWGARPSIEVLFASAADHHGGAVLGIVTQHTADDGAHGLWQIRQRGGIALDQATTPLSRIGEVLANLSKQER